MATESDRLAMFNQMRLCAMVADHLEPLRKEVSDAQWADYGRSVHENLMSDRFLQAVLVALAGFDPGNRNVSPQEHVMKKLRVFLTTGTIA